MSRKSKSRNVRAALKPQHQQVPQRERREPLARALPARWGAWLVPVLIAAVTVAAFLPTLQNQFVDWDDQRNFLDNPHYRGLGWIHLRWMWTAFYMGHYHPLTWMTFGLDYLLWGLNPVGYHLTALLLHALTAVVFYFVVLRLLGLALPSPGDSSQAGRALSAGLAALLFALHPLRVESVAWASERRDLLSGLFYLLTILAYLRVCERREPSRGWYWGTVGLFACALLSKSMAVSLPVVLLILDVYPLRRFGGAMGWWSGPARRVYLEKLPFVLLTAAAAAVAFLAQFRLDKSLAALDELSVLGRLAISAYGLSFYLWKMVVPVALSPLYERGIVNPWATPFLLSYGAVLAITALALALRRRVPGLRAVWLAYVVILLPVLGIFQNGPQIAADRYTYLAGMGWAIFAAAGLLSFWRRRPFVVTGLAACVLLGLGILTWNQAQVWRDRQTLWAHAHAIDHASPIAHFNLAHAFHQQGKLAEAVDHYRRAVQIKPDYADALNNLGNALAQQGKQAEAVEHYRQALKIKPDFAEALTNWGNALARQGQRDEAIEHYRRALTVRPDSAEALHNLGVLLARQGKLAEAIEHYRRALKIKPEFALALNNLGAALAQQGKQAEANEYFQRALRR